MLIKCVGGPNDDEFYEVDTNRHRLHDIIQIYQRPIMLPVIDMPNPNDLSEITATEIENYRLSCFRSRNEARPKGYDELLFLIHYPMNNMKAMEHQFKKNAILSDRARKTIKLLIEEHGFEYSLKVTLEDKIELARCLKIDDELKCCLKD